MKEEPKHGGARPGAGAKLKDESQKRLAFSARVDPATKERLEEIAAEATRRSGKKVSVGQVIDEMTRCYDRPLIVK